MYILREEGVQAYKSVIKKKTFINDDNGKQTNEMATTVILQNQLDLDFDINHTKI